MHVPSGFSERLPHTIPVAQGAADRRAQELHELLKQVGCEDVELKMFSLPSL